MSWVIRCTGYDEKAKDPGWWGSSRGDISPLGWYSHVEYATLYPTREAALVEMTRLRILPEGDFLRGTGLFVEELIR